MKTAPITTSWKTARQTALASGLFCFSLANLVMMPLWSRVFSFGTAFDKTFLEAFSSNFDWVDLTTGLTIALLFTSFFFSARLVTQRCRHRGIGLLEDLVIIGCVIGPIPLLPLHLWFEFPDLGAASIPKWIFGAGMAAFAAVLVLRFKLVAKAARAIVVIAILPAIVVTSNAVWGIFLLTPEGGNPFHQIPLTASVKEESENRISRVVWIIFDEMDQRMSFDERPETVKMPTFDRFRSTAFFASNARPPHSFTVNSIASLLTGRPVERIKQLPHDGIGIYFKGEEQQQSLSRLSTVFSDSLRLGANISAFGQIGYSYCRLFHTLISQCWNVDGWWKGKDDNVLTRMGTIARQGWQQVDRLIQGRNRFVNANLNHIERFKRVIQDLAATASDPRFHLVYAHLRMPHEPFIYNRFKDTYDPGADPDIGYLDNLELTDGVLAEVWKGMEAAGLWDRTAVIISADHSWRTANKYDGKIDKRVPFLVKLPGQKRPFAYAEELPTLGTRFLIRDIQLGKLVDPADIPSVLLGR